MATWEVSPDGRQYTFHLHSDLYFSDGTPITAQDFAYSIDRALDPTICQAYAGGDCTGQQVASTYLIDIVGADKRAAGSSPSIIGTGVQVPDAQTLVIKLDKPVAYFLEALTYPTSFPVEKTLIDKYPLTIDTHKNHADWTYHLNEGGCSGPFMIKSYAQDGKTITLVPNPYWYGPKPVLKQIIRPFVQDTVDAYQGYKAGKYDYSDVPAQEYQAARDQDDFHEVGLLQTNYVGINQMAKPFDDLRVRQAFALALNKQLIADRVLSGAALPTNHIVPEGMPGFYNGLTAPGISARSVTGDVEQAQQLMKNYFSGCGCSEIDVTLWYPHNTDRQHTAEAMANMWNTILTGTWGKVNVTPQDVGGGVHTLIVNHLQYNFGNKPGFAQMWLVAWIADYPDPQDWLSLQFAQGSANNWSNYHDTADFHAWQLMQQADVEQNQAKRMILYNQAEQQLVDSVAWLPYMQPKGIWRIKTYVQGYNPSSLELLSDQDWGNVSILAH
jgi:oligopeptide transport system substrate-binding protein